MAKYLEHILTAGTRKATAVQTSSNASIGLVVKKYWNKMVQIYSVVQKLQAEVGSILNHILHISETSDRTRPQADMLNLSLITGKLRKDFSFVGRKIQVNSSLKGP